MECPKCKSWFVRRVFVRSSHEMFLALFTVFPFRCQLCRNRFLAFAGRVTSGPRREYQRIMGRYPVTIWEAGVPKSERRVGKATTGIMVDLSIQGCGIAGTEVLKIGSRVRLTVTINEAASPLEIDEAIVRTQGHKRIGLEFLSIHPTEEERLCRVIESRLTGSGSVPVPMNRVRI